ncbi:MAG: Trm112 family protein [bacterium]|nr:Trm112 family protein [bacterium]
MIDEELLKIMCCPACHGDLIEREGKVVCLKCSRRYPIRDGIPVMLIDEAEMPEAKS